MCFSPEADFAAAVLLAPIGVLALRAAPGPRFLPLAALPMIFAIHQGIEGFVWLGLEGKVSPSVQEAAAWLYLWMAQVLLPFLVPLGMWLTEPDDQRRRLMVVPMLCGTFVAVWLGYRLILSGVAVEQVGHALAYQSQVSFGPWIVGGYLIATCGSVLLSSQRYLLLFGILNVIGLSIAATVRYETVASVWCVYAAMASGLVLLHLREATRQARVPAGAGRRPLPSD